MPEYPPGPRLTKRQSAILDLVGRGLSNKVIGFELGISEQVVKEYFSALLRRLGARNRGALGTAAPARGVIGSFQVNPDWLRYLFREAPVPIAVVVGPQHRHAAFNRSHASGLEARQQMVYRETLSNFARGVALRFRPFLSVPRGLEPATHRPSDH